MQSVLQYVLRLGVRTIHSCRFTVDYNRVQRPIVSKCTCEQLTNGHHCCVPQIQAWSVLLVVQPRLVLQIHSISGALVVCNAMDLTDLAADASAIAAGVSQQQCYIISDGESDILNPFVEQKATLTIGLCPLPDLFSAISVS